PLFVVMRIALVLFCNFSKYYLYCILMFNYYFYNRKDTKGKFMTEQTLLKYMQESHVLVDQAKVMDCTILEDGRTAFILNQTIFYPQGGGQPYDQGYIK